jgi:NAD(P)-dependent dehydrogenase (short-subunit alcohol dehydrogenase family)
MPLNLRTRNGGFKMSKDIKVALVTGGNRGIGYELVKQLALKGFKVILASRDPEMGHEAVQKLMESNLDVSFVEMDVDNQESIRHAAITINEKYGRLDVLINNAGVYLDKNEELLAMDPCILEKTMATNFFGVYHVIRSFIPLMEKQGYGRIINVSSEYGAMSEMSYPGVGAYKLSKFALNGLTRLVAAEINDDIKINAVDPGWVSTDMGGPSAPRTPKQAAESILWLSTVGPEGPNGGFFRDGKRIEW